MVAAADHKIYADDAVTGCGTDTYRTRWHDKALNEGMIESLMTRGYVVLDDVFDKDEAEDLEAAMSYTMDGMFGDNGLEESVDEEAAVSIRSDQVLYVDEHTSKLAPPISDALLKLKGFAETLQEPFAAELAAEDGNKREEWAQRDGGEHLLPGTSKRPLTVPMAGQLASFTSGGQYRIHSDNSRTKDGHRRNYRAVTAIAYAQPQDWDSSDGGCLRIWLGSDEIDLSTMPMNKGTTTLVRESLKEKLDGGEPDEDSSYFVDIMPLAGRVVLFRSTLLHQVCPSTRRDRRAVTVWFYCPQEESKDSR